MLYLLSDLRQDISGIINYQKTEKSSDYEVTKASTLEEFVTIEDSLKEPTKRQQMVRILLLTKHAK